jgi:hypothetical protein
MFIGEHGKYILVWNCPSDGDDYDLWLMEFKIVLLNLSMNHHHH